ncbi:MAG: glutamine-synthetase adenylyltransferase, partial [Gammaproteobacteria bacterium]|nr:glutamine-synthetase adenylyltransferase [Gammaproteobacteria bacterium]
MLLKNSDYSRFAKRVRRSFGDYLVFTPERITDMQAIEALWNKIYGLFPGDVAKSLRILRQLTLLRVLEWDCDANGSYETVVQTMTLLAEFTLNIAYLDSEDYLSQWYGLPGNAKGEAVCLWIVGMGKLGARELNVSSDIDLIYVYPEDGKTQADAHQKSISNHEFFTRLVKKIQTLIAEVNEWGFVFRIDLALRPNGRDGTVVLSKEALNQYFLHNAREWERFAWLKARVVAPLKSLGNAVELRDITLPFIFRKYLDYGIYNSLRELHKQIRAHNPFQPLLTEHAEVPSDDIKLGRGGIREIEFIVQLLQVVRGGQFPELRTRSTLQALVRLARGQLIDHLFGLSEAYRFLRQVEHRIQYLDDQQTHRLPQNNEDLTWISQSLQFSSVKHFLTQLAEHRNLIATEFDRIVRTSAYLEEGVESPSNRPPSESTETDQAPVPESRWQEWM